MELLLLQKVRRRFSVFGSIALLFGAGFAICFYKAGIGISFPVYVLLAIILIQRTANKIHLYKFQSGEEFESNYPLSNKQGKQDSNLKTALPYYIGSMLLAISNMLTASEVLHFFSIIGILLLLETSFLFQVLETKEQSFFRHLGQLFLLPLMAVGQLAAPFIDSDAYFKSTKLFKNERTRQVLLGVLITIPLLLIVLSLLSASDMIFSKLTGTITEHIFFSGDPIFILLLVLFLFLVCYCIICGICYLYDSSKSYDAARSAKSETIRSSNSVTAITITVCLTVIYLIFSAIQIVYLFGENGLPAGYTYAEYARQGFFELLAVTILNLIIVLICLKPARDSKVLQAILLVMSACTYIMIASAGYRMILYISAFHLTLLRVLVLWFLAMNTLMMAGAIISILKSKFPLYRYIIAIVSLFYIALAFARPDYIIASYNVDHDTAINREDLNYLTNLSADAASIILPLKDKQYDLMNSGLDEEGYQERIEDYAHRIYGRAYDRGIRGFNLSYYQSMEALTRAGYTFTKDIPNTTAYGLSDHDADTFESAYEDAFHNYYGEKLLIINLSSTDFYSVSVDDNGTSSYADNSAVEYGDYYWMDFDVVAGKTYTVEVNGQESQTLVTSDPFQSSALEDSKNGFLIYTLVKDDEGILRLNKIDQ